MSDSKSAVPSSAISDSNAVKSALLFGFVLLAILLVTFLVYKPGLSGSFLLDDTVNLQPLGAEGGIDSRQAALDFIIGNSSGPAGRPVSMASFLLDGQDWPAPASRFKYTNLMIHLMCGVLVAWFSLLLFGALKVRKNAARSLALFVAALWLLHPLNVSTTLYVIQRMTQLMALFSLVALILYLKGRLLLKEMPLKGILLMSLSLFPFGLLAVLSKENGALLLVAIAALEFSIFAGSTRNRLHRLWLAGGVLLPLLVIVGYLAGNFAGLTAVYQFRAFSIAERLLTEGRIVINYLFNIFIPVSSEFSLHRDDIVVSQGLFNPVSTLICWIVVLGLLIVAFWKRKRQPVFSFAVFWYFGWHLLESTFLPLELYFEHRNYLPMVGPLVAVVFYAYQLIKRHKTQFAERLGQTGVALSLVLLTVLTLQLTSLWGNSAALQAHWAEKHPGSFRAQVEYGYLLANFGESVQGYRHIAAIQQFYPDEVALQLLHWNYTCTYSIPAPYAIDDIAAGSSRVYYRADLTAEVRIFLENLMAARCEYPDQQQILALMERLANIPMRNYERSGFHLLYSDLYVHYRQLNPALIQLRNAFEIRPDPQYPIRQAVISASAGNYEDSLIFLQRAREANESRGPRVASRKDEIDAMERDLRSRLVND